MSQNQDLRFTKPDHIRFIQLTHPMTVGDRVCAAGDVLAVKPPGEKMAIIMPIDPTLYFDRAQHLVERKLARPHPGPATVTLGHSIRKPITESAGQAVEQEVIMEPGRRTATAAPQRGGRAGAI